MNDFGTYLALIEKEETMNTPPLDPCPFCKSAVVVIRQDGGIFWVRCLDCMATGPKNASKMDSLKMWNDVFSTRKEEP